MGEPTPADAARRAVVYDASRGVWARLLFVNPEQTDRCKLSLSSGAVVYARLSQLTLTGGSTAGHSNDRGVTLDGRSDGGHGLATGRRRLRMDGSDGTGAAGPEPRGALHSDGGGARRATDVPHADGGVRSAPAATT